jgi:MIP family channel proteins
MESPSLSLRLAAEALGTFLFFFLGFNSIAVATDVGGGAITTLGIAFAFGLGLALAITALGHVSGGHFNPAVSLGLAAARKFPPAEVVPYWIAQLVGGFVAVLAVAVVYSEHAVDALNTAPGAGISSGGAFLLELIVTALFVLVIITVATDDRAPWKGVMAPLLIGLFIFTAADAVGPASGGSFNPARSLDPAIYNLDFGKIWIYLLAPLLGGVIGGGIRLAFGPAAAHEPSTIRAAGGVPQAATREGNDA